MHSLQAANTAPNSNNNNSPKNTNNNSKKNRIYWNWNNKHWQFGTKYPVCDLYTSLSIDMNRLETTKTIFTWNEKKKRGIRLHQLLFTWIDVNLMRIYNVGFVWNWKFNLNLRFLLRIPLIVSVFFLLHFVFCMNQISLVFCAQMYCVLHLNMMHLFWLNNISACGNYVTFKIKWNSLVNWKFYSFVLHIIWKCYWY